jgi:hypothetical protein
MKRKSTAVVKRKSARRMADHRAVRSSEDHPIGEPGADAAGAQADRLLVDRCLAGEPAAWEELYGHYHALLCDLIGSLLGQGYNNDPNVIDEIAARVWYELVKDDGRLLGRFDPCRDVRLGAFLRGLARIEIMRYRRGEHRRCEGEAKVRANHRRDTPLSEYQVDALLSEFAATLTPNEQLFLRDYALLPSAGGEDEDEDTDSTEPSDSSVWQRCHRIRMKLRAFFAGGL